MDPLPAGYVGAMSVSAGRSRRRRWGAIAFVGGITVAFFIYVIVYFGATYQGLDSRCFISGPRSPLAQVSEVPSVEGNFSHWPLGRECEWRRADGGGTVIARSEGWPETIAVLLSASVALAGLGLMTSAAVRRA